jgi:hypothetical protein
MFTWFILKSGLIFNLIGSIMIAFSIGKNYEGAYQTKNNKKIYLASIMSPTLFWWGIWLLIVGFGLSIADTVILDAFSRIIPR